MKVLVTGGHGFIGSYVVEELLKQNIEVVCLVRKTSNLQWLHSLNVHYYEADLKDKSTLQNLPSDIDVVIHLAGLIKALDAQEYFLNE